MGFFSRTPRPGRRPADRSLLRFLLVLLLVYGGARMLAARYAAEVSTVGRARSMARAQTIRMPPAPFEPAYAGYGFGGAPVARSGSLLDLGQALPGPGGTVLAWLFGAREMVLSSCLTAVPPAVAGPIAAAVATRPVRDYLPGFYGAPWTARFGGDLVALLHVYAPRDAAAPVVAPLLQIYRRYEGGPAAPDFATAGAARVYRGSAAVLYRVFLSGPVRCLDLVVPRGHGTGTGYLYYQRYRRYYEAEQVFALQ